MVGLRSGYKVGGIQMYLVDATIDGWLIYSSEDKGEKTGTFMWEVIKIRYHKKDSYINGRLIAEAGSVRYPGKEEWGHYGWTCNSYQRCISLIGEKNETDI